ncbi:MAG: Pyruvate dehydrogenase complex repressor [Firmicutes bacterium ADurb.Bin182]|nr:MAG: Pyruvate dehydrogenase complex repressor [Firmicutes bacterium ADurb.Bin182]
MIAMLIRRDTLVDQAYEHLCDMIREMTPGANKLPSEEALSEMLDVSRPTVRGALKRLEKDGYITTVHGIGTFGHPSMFRMKGRIDVNTDFYQLIKCQHKDIAVQNLHFGVQQSSREFCMHFNCSPQDVYRMLWTYTASGLPTIVCVYEFLLSIIREMPQEDDQYRDLDEFSRKCLYHRITYCTMCLAAVQNSAMAVRLGVQEDAALLSIEEMIYDIGDHPVGFANCYIHPSNMRLTMAAQFGKP